MHSGRDIPPRTLTPARSFDDHDPARGVCYVVPRQNDIIIGGTAQANNWDTKISKRDTEEIKRRAVRNFPELANMEVLEVKVGLRPARSEIRVETEAFDGGKRVRTNLDLLASHNARAQIVVHNYGHGGSGWTVAWGCGVPFPPSLSLTISAVAAWRCASSLTRRCPRCRRIVNCETTAPGFVNRCLGSRCPSNAFP